MPPNANYTLHYDGTVTVSLNYIMHERPKENPEGLINQLMSVLFVGWVVTASRKDLSRQTIWLGLKI